MKWHRPHTAVTSNTALICVVGFVIVFFFFFSSGHDVVTASSCFPEEYFNVHWPSNDEVLMLAVERDLESSDAPFDGDSYEVKSEVVYFSLRILKSIIVEIFI